MSRLFLDIETIPTESPDVIAEIAAGVRPPSTYSKQDSIARWEAEQKPALVDDAVRRTAFDGTYGSVVCICYAVDDGPVQTIARGTIGECTVLHELSVPAINPHTTVLVGHNIAFDIRFLWQRYVINRIKPPLWLVKSLRAKPWDAADDTMLMWHSDRDRRISLDKLCRALRIDSPKGDLDGAGVYDAWRRGEIANIAAYCARDVIAVRECYRLMTT